MIIDSRRMTGWKFDRPNGYLEVFVRGTSMARFDDASNDLKLLTNGLTINSGGVTITTGGMTVSAGGATVTGDTTYADKITYSDQLVHANAIVETIASNKTLDVYDTGKIFQCATDSVVFTLPSMSGGDVGTGYTVTIVNTGTDGAVGLYATPATGDKIMGIGLTAADEKYLNNAKGTAKKGDFVTLIADASLGYYVTESAGTWTREA